MKILSIISMVIFLSQQAFAGGVYQLACKSSQDSFSVEINSAKQTVEFTERSQFDIAVDPGVYKGEISKAGVFVWANISTYDYFSGDVKFYLGKGLYQMENNQEYKIALDAYDGDGYGFSKRPYNCKVTFLQKCV